MARLEVRKLKRVSRIEMAPKPITIGRSSHNDLVLRDKCISREHCIIEIENDRVTVRDLGSRTGTYVNNHRITGAILGRDDRITIGPFVLRVRDADELFKTPPVEANPIAAQEQISSPESTQSPFDAAQQLLAQQTSQIAELTAAAASLHSELVSKTDRMNAIEREMESMIQRQRHTEATRQTALERIERTERKLADLLLHVRTLEQASHHLKALQDELAAAERAWVAADDHARREGANEEIQKRRAVTGAMLDHVSAQRDSAIDELQQAVARFRHFANETPAMTTNQIEVESKPAASSRHWWRFGARKTA